MITAVRYYSRTGNTKAIAEQIAGAAGCTAESIEMPLEEGTDLLFLGGGVYWGKIPKELKEYVKFVSPQKVRRVAVFATADVLDITCKIYQDYLRHHDIKVMKDTYFCNCKKVNDVENQKKIADFAKKVMEEVSLITSHV